VEERDVTYSKLIDYDALEKLVWINVDGQIYKASVLFENNDGVFYIGDILDETSPHDLQPTKSRYSVEPYVFDELAKCVNEFAYSNLHFLHEFCDACDIDEDTLICSLYLTKNSYGLVTTISNADLSSTSKLLLRGQKNILVHVRKTINSLLNQCRALHLDREFVDQMIDQFISRLYELHTGKPIATCPSYQSEVFLNLNNVDSLIRAYVTSIIPVMKLSLEHEHLKNMLKMLDFDEIDQDHLILKTSNSVRFDLLRFKIDYPDLYAEYSRKTTTKSLRIKEDSEYLEQVKELIGN
jgi:hypothetical protein